MSSHPHSLNSLNSLIQAFESLAASLKCCMPLSLRRLGLNSVRGSSGKSLEADHRITPGLAYPTDALYALFRPTYPTTEPRIVGTPDGINGLAVCASGRRQETLLHVCASGRRGKRPYSTSVTLSSLSLLVSSVVSLAFHQEPSESLVWHLRLRAVES